MSRLCLEDFYKGLDETFKEGNQNTVLSYLRSWIVLAEERGDEDDVIAVKNETGGLLRTIGQTDEAKKLYRDILDIMKSRGQTNDEHYATVLINYGDVFVSSGEMAIAFEKFSEARRILELAGYNQDYRMAALCNNLSHVYCQMERFRDAEISLDKALSIIENMQPEYRVELVTTYVNLGNLQVSQGKMEEAGANFQKAVDIYDELDSMDVHYPAALAGLGRLQYAEKRYDEAEVTYKKVLGLVEKIYGRTDTYDLILENIERIRSEKNNVFVKQTSKNN